MKIYRSLDEFKRLAKAVVTIGTFDGVHIGHQRIVQRLSEIARTEGGETVVLTFFPHPRMVLQPDDNTLRLLSTLSERELLLEKAGVDHLIIHPFSKDFSRLSAVDFVRDLLVTRIGLHTLVIGYDHHFGRNREGSHRDLEEMSSVYGFHLEEIPPQEIDEVAVSSTKIRNALMTGDVNIANQLLGYEYMLHGKVVNGDRIGRTLGFPTANLELQENYKLIPADGIYAIHADLEGESHLGMLYIGNRPVLGGTRKVIEAHLFEFDRDIYGQYLTIRLIQRIRGDKHVADLEELKTLMEEDRRIATKILS
ncbi:MAG: bifunctional riboflavin kinase/FAD synthetase [Bacteroidota bacterium]